MGCREFSDDGVSQSRSEALVFATMCIIGLPVEIHVRDGSVYAGILHTACLGKDYGIILKKARMIKKGKLEANVGHGGIVETLVVLTGDLVQIVAKGVQLPADGIVRNITGEDTEAAAGTIPSFECLGTDAKMLKPSNTDVRTKQITNTRNSAQNENGFAHGFVATPSEDNLMSRIEEHEVRRKEPSYLGSALEIENGKRDPKILAKSAEAPSFADNGRLVEDDRIQGKQDHSKQKYDLHQKETTHEIQDSSSSLDTCLTHIKAAEEIDGKMASELLPNGGSHYSLPPSCVKPDKGCSESAGSATTDDISSDVSTSSNSVLGVPSESCSTSLATPTEVPPRRSISYKIAKESKLNPGAKVFSPSFTNLRSVTPPAVPAVASMAYVPNNSSVAPVASSQTEIGISPFVPRSSLPVKFVPYSNLMVGNAGSGSQFSQPIIGHMASRPQPVRYAGQYQPVQAGPAYVHPNSQAVMVGRLGQLVYVHPVSYDVVPGAAAISQLSARPLLTPNPVQFPKHQGSVPSQAVQLRVPPPLLANNGQQPFAVTSHIPLVQPPFPANRPIPVPGPNALFNTKFP